MNKKDEKLISGLKELFAFGIPGGRSKVQRAIGKYLNGDDTALEKMPAIKKQINSAVTKIKTGGQR